MKKFLTRRQALQEAAVGFGALALNAMMAEERAFGSEVALAKERIYDLSPKPPHFPAKAKNVIFIYVGGGPSTIDMFDPKPVLMKFDGKPAPFEIKGRALNGSQQIMASPWKFADCGDNGHLEADQIGHHDCHQMWRDRRCGVDEWLIEFFREYGRWRVPNCPSPSRPR